MDRKIGRDRSTAITLMATASTLLAAASTLMAKASTLMATASTPMAKASKLMATVTATTLTLMATAMLCTSPVLAETPEQQADDELAAGNFKSACQLYKLALSTHRSDVSLLIKAAQAYEGAGDMDEAIHRAREATVFEPNNADARLALGHFLDANRDDKAAILQFEMALDLKKAKPETRKRAFGPLLRLLHKQGDLDKLIKTARRGAHDFPQDADCHYNLGWALTQMPNTDPKEFAKSQQEAIAEYEKSILLGEKRVAVHLNLAALLANSGNNSAAGEELATYLKLAPEDADRKEVKALREKISKQE